MISPIRTIHKFKLAPVIEVADVSGVEKTFSISMNRLFSISASNFSAENHI
jgi:hypothetical protein